MDHLSKGDLPIQRVIFHSYVELPEGSLTIPMVNIIELTSPGRIVHEIFGGCGFRTSPSGNLLQQEVLFLGNSITGLWFGTCFIFPCIQNHHPNWLIFFRGVGRPPTRSTCTSSSDSTHQLDQLGQPQVPTMPSAFGRRGCHASQGAQTLRWSRGCGDDGNSADQAWKFEIMSAMWDGS